MQDEATVELVGGPLDGDRRRVCGTRYEHLVRAGGQIVYAVYVEERPGRLVFLGHRDDTAEVAS
jgi:hypothetical protein